MLLTTWGSNNLIITQGKTISYSQSYIKLDYGWTYGPPGGAQATYDWQWAWEFHRYCSMSFEYVGMTYATAERCAAAIVDRYTRKFEVSNWNPPSNATPSTLQFVDEFGGNIPMVDASVQHQGGNMYSVIVNVREDDSRIRLTNVENSPYPITRTYNAADQFADIDDSTSQYYRTYEDASPTPDSNS